jgi:hypothetical protein
MESAVFGLIGVVVGGLLTGGTQLWLERRRERYAVSRAKRLVSGELLSAILIMRTIYNTPSKTWPYFQDPDTALQTSAWQEHRTHLATVLTEEVWERLVMAYTVLEIDRGRLHLANDTGPDVPLTDEVVEGFERSVSELVALRRELDGKSSVRPGQG